MYSGLCRKQYPKKKNSNKTRLTEIKHENNIYEILMLEHI